MSSGSVISDYLVIGTGIAGLSFALQAAKHGQVRIITKKQSTDAATNYAQGGIAAVVAPGDSFDLHVSDTLNAGAGLCREDAVRMLVEEGPKRIRELIEWGVEFTRSEDPDMEFDLGREGGHSRNRVLHAGDITGRGIEKALLKAASGHPNITIEENRVAVDLLTEHHFKPNFMISPERLNCYGAYVLDAATDKVNRYLAGDVILCTGGAGHVYSHTTNPSISTGDGIAMAYRAGARISNLEFVQFHPTALYQPNGDTFLLSEAIRGFGGKLRTVDGEEFMRKYDKRGDLASRDIVARAIDAELKKKGDKYVYLDLRHLDAEKVKKRFPNIYAKCLEFKVDITGEPIPVVPAAHYMCGGVSTDLFGRTTINHLWALGESACTGVHGANRLASNSLLEAVVYSHRAAKALAESKPVKELSFPDVPTWDDSGTYNPEEWVLISHNRQEIQALMSDLVGIIRTNVRLERARRRLLLINSEVEDYYRRTKVSEELIVLRNLAAVAWLIVKSAAMRKESRGLHFNADYPDLDRSLEQKETEIVRHFSTHDELGGKYRY